MRIAPAALNQIDSRRLGWLVPGLLDEKVTAVLRGLPKALRVRFVPVPETARKVASLLKFGVGDFAEELATAVRLVSGIDIPRETIAAVDLPTHLRIHIAIVDESGKVLVRGQNLDDLRREWNQKAAAQFEQLSATHRQWHRDGVLTWDFGDLPDDVPLRNGPLTLRGHVAIQDTHDAARLRLVDTAERAKRESRTGVRRLLQLACRKEIHRQLDYFPELKKHLIVAAALPTRRRSFARIWDSSCWIARREASSACRGARQTLPNWSNRHAAASAKECRTWFRSSDRCWPGTRRRSARWNG